MWCLVVFHDVEFTTALLCKVCAPFPVVERGEPHGGLPVFTRRFSLPFLPPIFTPDFYPHFYPRFCRRFSLPFFTPDFARDFYPRFSLAIFRGRFPPGIFHPPVRGRFSPPIFPVQNFHPLYRHGPDSHPPLNESAKNDTFTISAKSVMLRTQIPAPQKPSPTSPKPHPQKPLSPKGDIGVLGMIRGLQSHPQKSSPKVPATFGDELAEIPERSKKVVKVVKSR